MKMYPLECHNPLAGIRCFLTLEQIDGGPVMHLDHKSQSPGGDSLFSDAWDAYRESDGPKVTIPWRGFVVF